MIVNVLQTTILESIDALALRANWYTQRRYEVPGHVSRALNELCALVGYRVLADEGRRWYAVKVGA